MAEMPDPEGASSANVSYDTERLGEPGQPGVPLGDQSPTNEENDNVTESGQGAGVRVPEKEE
ncbi:MAG: hypothetical protein ACT4NY_23470 [Pseudonocardiales bacterium]